LRLWRKHNETPVVVVQRAAAAAASLQTHAEVRAVTTIHQSCLCAAAAAEIWTAVLAALLAGTLQNWVFPFFTYVPSSGMFGEVLPQVRRGEVVTIINISRHIVSGTACGEEGWRGRFPLSDLTQLGYAVLHSTHMLQIDCCVPGRLLITT
jgi:hypothetical protein